MLATVRDDTWNVFSMQHTTPNLKRWDYSDIPDGGNKNIKGSAHMAEGGHHLRKAPNPHPWQDSDLCKNSPEFYWFYTCFFKYFADKLILENFNLQTAHLASQFKDIVW